MWGCMLWKKYINSGTLLNENLILEQLDCFKDLGVKFDNHLSFQQHCYDKINKAYSILGIIKRNFKYLTPEALVQIYKSMVRSHLEYAQSVWYPYRQKLIDDLEKVQKRATKLVTSLRNDHIVKVKMFKTADINIS